MPSDIDPPLPHSPQTSPQTPPQIPPQIPPQTPPDAALAADRVTRLTRTLALGGLVGLIVLGLCWELWLAPTGSGTLALKVLPLVPPLLGVWRYRMQTYRWLSLLVWLYFAEGITRAITDRGLSSALAMLEVALTLLLFAACALHVRWRLSRSASAAAAA